MTTIIQDSVLFLTPLASVDTSSSSNGYSMFSILMENVIDPSNNLIQFEYWISTGTNLVPVTDGNGFIPLENAVTTQGISNQITIAIPSLDNNYDPSTQLDVKIRCYVGTVHGDSPGILVSHWSNTCPVHAPPAQPSEPTAYIVRGSEPYVYDDLMYVQIPTSVNYEDTIRFIVSYSYTTGSNENRWVVSEILTGTIISTFISLPPITLPTDALYSTNIYVAVNAVFPYTHSDNTYYSVSEISTTVVAVNAGFEAPVLAPISIPNDYNIYGELAPGGDQTIDLTWEVPSSTIIPNFEIDHFLVNLVVSGYGPYVPISLSSTATTYTYEIPSELIALSETSSLDFTVTAVYSSGDEEVSNTESVNTFTFATEPRNLSVAWANPGTTEGEINIAITFNNPSSNGFGEVVNFVAEVWSDDTRQFVQSITHVPGSDHQYAVFLTGTASTSGFVKIYMVNIDTNDSETGPRQRYAGAFSTQNYTVGELPVILNVDVTSNVLTFNVISQTLLVLINRFVGTGFNTFEFNSDTTPGVVHVNYSVTMIQLGTYDYYYTFTFNDAFFEQVGIPDVAIMVANEYGIGFGNYINIT